MTAALETRRWLAITVLAVACASPRDRESPVGEDASDARTHAAEAYRVAAVHYAPGGRIDVAISCPEADWIRPGMSVGIVRDAERIGFAVVWEVKADSVRAVFISTDGGAALEPAVNDTCLINAQVLTEWEPGRVLRLLEGDRIVLSLGHQDGVRVGHEFSLSRGNRFVGFASATEVSAEQSVARFDTLHAGSGAPPRVDDRCYPK